MKVSIVVEVPDDIDQAGKYKLISQTIVAFGDVCDVGFNVDAMALSAENNQLRQQLTAVRSTVVALQNTEIDLLEALRRANLTCMGLRQELAQAEAKLAAVPDAAIRSMQKREPQGRNGHTQDWLAIDHWLATRTEAQDAA